MARKKVSRNTACPCGSGKKYKHCCHGKRFDYEEDDDGTIFKSIPMSQEMVDLLQERGQVLVRGPYGGAAAALIPVELDPRPQIGKGTDIAPALEARDYTRAAPVSPNREEPI